MTLEIRMFLRRLVGGTPGLRLRAVADVKGLFAVADFDRRFAFTAAKEGERRKQQRQTQAQGGSAGHGKRGRAKCTAGPMPCNQQLAGSRKRNLSVLLRTAWRVSARYRPLRQVDAR